MNNASETQLTDVERFVRDHPGHFVSRNARCVVMQVLVMQVEAWESDKNETYNKEYCVWSMRAARDLLGY